MSGGIPPQDGHPPQADASEPGQATSSRPPTREPMSARAQPSTPRELLERYGLYARKSWGQNFLHAMHVHLAIAQASGASLGQRVVEIGAGLGTLTWHLLKLGGEVEAIERDRDLCAVLREEFRGEARLTLHEADAVAFDYAGVRAGADGRRASIVGNLPYQLTGALLFRLLDVHQETGVWVVMVQREVADRLCAPVGTKSYGAATVSLSRVRAIHKVCDVGRHCFLPAPRVDSAVIALTPRETPRGEVQDARAYSALVRGCFQQRRKTLANALGSVASSRELAQAWCDAAGIDSSLRPERLTPEDFAALQRAREQSRA